MKIENTQNYARFVFDKTNRTLRDAHLTKMRKSMRRHGWLPAYPILVRRVGEKLSILDGQHRFTVAQEQKLPVLYVITEADVSIPEINAPQQAWSGNDFIESFCQQGKSEYLKIKNFASAHNLSLMTSARIFGNLTQSKWEDALKRGEMVCGSQEKAETIARLMALIQSKGHEWIKRHSSYVALIHLLRLREFDIEQFAAKIEKFPHLLHQCPTIESQIQNYDECYNYQSHKKLPLAFLASQAKTK